MAKSMTQKEKDRLVEEKIDMAIKNPEGTELEVAIYKKGKLENIYTIFPEHIQHISYMKYESSEEGDLHALNYVVAGTTESIYFDFQINALHVYQTITDLKAGRMKPTEEEKENFKNVESSHKDN